MSDNRGKLWYFAWYLGISTRERLFGGKRIDLFEKEKFSDLQTYYQAEVLDVGCGRGDFAKMLFDEGLDVACIDVVNKIAFPELSFTPYDGNNIPFADNRFKTSLAMFILHHADDQQQVLAEMARVTDGHILIGEDVLENRLDRLFAEGHIRSSQWSQGAKGFHTHQEWLAIFAKLGLELVETRKIPRYKEPIYPVARRVYVLKTPPVV